MSRRISGLWIRSAACAAAFAVSAASGLRADDSPATDSSPATTRHVTPEVLLERLRAAEQRIADLEAAAAPAPAVKTGYAQVSDDAEGSSAADEGSTIRVAPPEGGDVAPEDHSENAGTAVREAPPEGGDVAPERHAKEVEDLTKRLEDLQKEWDAHQGELKDLEDAEANKPTFEAGGRIHLDYWSFLESSDGIDYFEHPDDDDPRFGTDPEDRFLFRRIRLELEGTVPDLMFWRIQADFNEPENPQIKDVYLGWDLPANHQLIVGHQKLPMGLDALDSSRYTTFMERPQVVDAFVTDSRRLGAKVLGFSDDRVFNWQYGIFEVQDIQDTGRYIGDSLQLGGYGRLASTPWYDETSDGRGYLHLAVSGSLVRPDGDVSDADSNSNVARFNARPESRSDRRWIDTGPIRGAQWFEQSGLEAVLNLGAWQFTGEFMSTWVQRDDDTLGTGPDVMFHGGYLQAAYFLTGEHIPWDREQGVIGRVHPFENFFLIDRCTGGTGSGWGAWQVATRFDYLDLTDSDIRGGVENNLTCALNWWWNPYARLQFNVTRGVIEQHREVAGFDSGDFWLAGTRFAIDF